MPPLVEIGLTDLSKSGGTQAPSAPPLATGLSLSVLWPISSTTYFRVGVFRIGV